MPGHKRSRALWGEARRPGAPRTALLRAILYEIQPVRFSSLEYDGLLAWLATALRTVMSFMTDTVPSLSRTSYRLVSAMSRRNWMAAVAVVAYYYFVRFAHRIMDAGPLVMILTALVVIFTFGLGDTHQSGLSAYSVFNRGFHRLIGDLDADALVQQHIGGGAMALGGILPPAPPLQQDDNHIPPMGRQDEGEARLPNRNNNDANVRDDDGHDNEPGQPGRARRSGKKARRRNQEQRREVQRQRQAAMDMGFAGDGGEQEMMAMQRLLEEQIAAGNNRNDAGQ